MAIQRRTIDDTARCCQEERQMFRMTGERSSPCCTELFRRAFASDQDAWAAIDSIFHPVIQRWIQTVCAKWPDLFSLEDYADLTQNAKHVFMAYAGTRLPPLTTDDLDRILAYWRTCARNSVLQAARQLRSRPPTDLIGERPIAAPAADPTLRLALQQQLPLLLETDDERLVFDRYFVQGFPPRDIAQHYPDRFASAAAVSQLLQNLRRRFRKDPILRMLAGLDARDASSDAFSAADAGENDTDSSAPDSDTRRRRKPLGPTSLEIHIEGREKAELPMEIPCDLDEAIIFDYIANLLPAAQRIAIEANPACFAQAQRIAAEVAQIEAMLYRATCPELDQLTAYHDRELAGTQALVVMRHAEQCERCREELAMLAAIDAIPLETPGPLAQLRRVVEALLQPGLAFQLRGQAYIYTAPQVLITLSLRQSPGDAPRWMLSGELSAADGAAFAGTVEAVVAYRNDQTASVAEIEPDGAFIVRMLPAGDYRLVIRTLEEEITIRSLSIGINDADE